MAKRKLEIKPILIVAILLLNTFFIVSCKKNGDPNRKTSGPGLDNTGPRGEIVAEDEEKLVKVKIKDGKAKMYFDLEAWDETHDFTNLIETAYPGERIAEAECSIVDVSGPVKDAIIAKVTDMHNFGFDGFVMPVVFLLMEDGTVEYVMAFPRYLFYRNDIESDTKPKDYGTADITCSSSGRLPWIRDIVSLFYEPEYEGRRDKTVYAVDAKGRHYNLKIPCSFQHTFNRKWEARLYPPGDDFENYMVFLTFGEDGYATLQKGLKESEADEIYVGTYEVFLDEELSGGYRPGIFKFDLKLDYSAWGDTGTEGIRGSYFSESHKDGPGITFWLSDGDPFHEGVDKYKFLLQHESGPMGKVSIWELSEEMVFEYLMSAVPKVSEMVMLHGMALMLEDGGDTFIDGVHCRIVWLGTAHEEHFVKEILYAMDDLSRVYEYDAVNDKWIYVGN